MQFNGGSTMICSKIIILSSCRVRNISDRLHAQCINKYFLIHLAYLYGILKVKDSHKRPWKPNGNFHLIIRVWAKARYQINEIIAGNFVCNLELFNILLLPGKIIDKTSDEYGLCCA